MSNKVDKLLVEDDNEKKIIIKQDEHMLDDNHEDKWTTKQLQKVKKAYENWRQIHGDKYNRMKLMLEESNKGSASTSRQFVNFHNLDYNVANLQTLNYWLMFLDELIKGGNKNIIPVNGAWQYAYHVYLKMVVTLRGAGEAYPFVNKDFKKPMQELLSLFDEIQAVKLQDGLCYMINSQGALEKQPASKDMTKECVESIVDFFCAKDKQKHFHRYWLKYAFIQHYASWCKETWKYPMAQFTFTKEYEGFLGEDPVDYLYVPGNPQKMLSKKSTDFYESNPQFFKKQEVLYPQLVLFHRFVMNIRMIPAIDEIRFTLEQHRERITENIKFGQLMQAKLTGAIAALLFAIASWVIALVLGKSTGEEDVQARMF